MIAAAVDVYQRGGVGVFLLNREKVGTRSFGPEFEMLYLLLETQQVFFELCLKSEEFGALAQAMMRASPEKAIRAFGLALQDGIPEQVEKNPGMPEA